MNYSTRDTRRILPAVILIGLGVLFLLGQTFHFDFFGSFWPLFVMLPGFAFLYAAINGDQKTVGLIVPGSVITGTGLILLYQSITNHWESWAYAWSLYPVFVGMALSYMGQKTSSDGTYKAGQGLIRWGLIAFVSLWALFELVIFNSGGIFGSYLVPIVLIGLGVWLLFRQNTTSKRKVFVPEKPKNMNGNHSSYSDDLQKRIDEALAEDDKPKIV